jgi:ATP adenylyltransferase
MTAMASHSSPAAGTLRADIERVRRQALACGAQQPVETRETFIEDGGIRFLVRVVSALARKETGREAHAANADANPFLPPERELFVADLSDTHLCLLNKFNVIEHHLLIVTRAFEHQETLLTPADFEALAICLAQYEGLGFYNGGVAAGASQPHKHLQLVPLPLSPASPELPIAPLLRAARDVKGIGRLPGLPFRHAFAWLPPWPTQDLRRHAALLHARYRELFRSAGLRVLDSHGETRQSGPYNLLVTRAWMLLVPRRQEHFDTISINALAFAGSLFVKSEAQLAALRARGPAAALRAVTLPSG